MDLATMNGVTTAPARPAFADLLERARSLGPALSSAAFDTEAAGRVPASSMQLLREAGLFKLVQPARFGGYEYGPAEAAEIAFELGRACGSTGWCGSLAIYFQLMLSYFPLSTQEKVTASENPIIAVSYTPSAQCEVVDGGFRIQGTWPYASNSDNAGWFMVAVLVPGAEGGRPTPHWMLAPAAEFTIDDGSWRVAGLQGTGSKAVTARAPIFVPAADAIRVPDVMAGTVPGVSIEDNGQARFAFPTFGPTCLVSPVLGMAQGALDAFIANAVSRVRAAKPGIPNPVSASPQLQSRIGWASATIDAAKALLVDSLRAAEQQVRAGHTVPARDRLAIRRNQGYAAAQAVAVVNDLYGHNGTAGTSSATALQRFWRDANAGALHVTLDWEAISAMYGQSELGLEPVGIY
jgi:3-hydroxy-9,10-secoandrosta-1,3,5(10)-triene-9,17-dione monooxygenase